MVQSVGCGKLHFGCRLLAYVSSDAVAPQQVRQVVEDALVGNENALKAQASNRQTHPLADRFSLTTPAEVQTRALEGNQDGWGLVGYTAEGLCARQISGISAHVDAGFVPEVAEISHQHGLRTVLAHLLKSPPDRKPNRNNLHPFRYGDWTGMLNGGMRGFVKTLRDDVTQQYSELLGAQIQGASAGEVGFYLFLGCLKKQFGTVQIHEIGLAHATLVFAEVMAEIKAKAVANRDKLLPGKTVGVNFAFSDGEHLLAYRYGRSLFVGTCQLEPGHCETILASEPLAVDDITRGFQWQEVPEDTVVVISRQNDPHGEQVRLMPLSDALQKRPASVVDA